MKFRILGPVEVELDGPLVSTKGRKPRALLGLLLLHRNEPVAPEQLIDDLWGESAPATAANTLQVYVSQVRKIVAERFERLAGEGATALGRKAYGEASELLGEALALWRGPALADLRYESFAPAEIARLEEPRLVAVEDRT